MPSPMTPDDPFDDDNLSKWELCPWMSRPSPHPADSSPEHARALELLQRCRNAGAAFNNPDLVYPGMSPSAEVPGLSRAWGRADRALDEHLIKHRAVLGTHPDWTVQYDLIDNPGDDHPTGDPEGFLAERDPGYDEDAEPPEDDEVTVAPWVPVKVTHDDPPF